MMNKTISINYYLGRFGEAQIVIRLAETFYSLRHGLGACLFINSLCFNIDTQLFFLNVYPEIVKICNRLKKMGGRRKRVELASCKDWKKKEIWDILEEGKFTGFMEKLKGSNPSITRQFIKTWKDGSILVGNQRMEVTEDIIVEATCLDTEGINFYRDRKLSDRVVEEFAKTAKERNRLVKICNSYFRPGSISRPWRFVMFVVIEYLTLDDRFTKIFGYHFMLVNYFRHRVRLNLPFYLRQSLGTTILAIQNDPEGGHACHEGLMVLVMNLLKSKKLDRPRFNKKTMECETKGNEQDEGFDEDTEDEIAEIEVKKRKKLELGSLSGKKRKIKETDSNVDTDSEEGNGKSGIAGKVSKNKGKNMDRAPSIPSDDEPLIKRME